MQNDQSARELVTLFIYLFIEYIYTGWASYNSYSPRHLVKKCKNRKAYRYMIVDATIYGIRHVCNKKTPCIVS